MKERRQEYRYPYHLPVVLRSQFDESDDSEGFDGRMVNVSASGALISSFARVSVGDSVSILLDGDFVRISQNLLDGGMEQEHSGFCRIDCRVVRLEQKQTQGGAGKVAVAFKSPLRFLALPTAQPAAGGNHSL